MKHQRADYNLNQEFMPRDLLYSSADYDQSNKKLKSMLGKFVDRKEKE